MTDKDRIAREAISDFVSAERYLELKDKLYALLDAAAPFIEIASSFDGIEMKGHEVISPVLWPRELTWSDWRHLRSVAEHVR